MYRIYKFLNNHPSMQKVLLLAMPALLFSSAAWAAGPPPQSSIGDPLVITLVFIMVVLLAAIALLANVLLGVARFQQETEKSAQKNNPGGGVAAILIGLLLLSVPGLAQDATGSAGPDASGSFGGLSSTAFYFMAAVIMVEVLVIIAMLAQLRGIVAREKEIRVKEAIAKGEIVKRKPKINWWDWFNKFRPMEQEADLDLGHNYDGIRELDNRLPPWWLYGFYITIVFAGIYLWRYHVAHTAPLSAEEFEISMKKAEEQQQEYLKKSASLVDENTVKILTSEIDLNAGRNIFKQNCTPCHGNEGQGNQVGPNLTDNYWLHGGSIHDIFRTIKYGWQDKGMKSWKDDFTASQIAQIASYVMSLKGSNPPNPKPPQGEIYQENAPGPAADSTGKTTGSGAKDSTANVTTAVKAK